MRFYTGESIEDSKARIHPTKDDESREMLNRETLNQIFSALVETLSDNQVKHILKEIKDLI